MCYQKLFSKKKRTEWYKKRKMKCEQILLFLQSDFPPERPPPKRKNLEGLTSGEESPSEYVASKRRKGLLQFQLVVSQNSNLTFATKLFCAPGSTKKPFASEEEIDIERHEVTSPQNGETITTPPSLNREDRKIAAVMKTFAQLEKENKKKKRPKEDNTGRDFPLNFSHNSVGNLINSTTSTTHTTTFHHVTPNGARKPSQRSSFDTSSPVNMYSNTPKSSNNGNINASATNNVVSNNSPMLVIKSPTSSNDQIETKVTTPIQMPPKKAHKISALAQPKKAWLREFTEQPMS